MVDLGANRALYSISVAAEVTGVNPQMLRVYEQRGLLAPHRTEGGTRRYSGHELDRVGEITTLLAAGLNLTGVEHVLRLRAENHRLQREVARLRARPRKNRRQLGRVNPCPTRQRARAHPQPNAGRWKSGSSGPPTTHHAGATPMSSCRAGGPVKWVSQRCSTHSLMPP